jgi:hypothetical protein
VSPIDRQLLSEAFIELADTAIADSDAISFLHVLTDRSVQLLGASAAVLLLADPDGELHVVAASSEAARRLELSQLPGDQGPCADCFRSGRPVAANVGESAQRWPRFSIAASRAGFASIHVLPLRLGEQIIGALSLVRRPGWPFDPADLRIGQALADATTVSLLARYPDRGTLLGEQLQAALNSLSAIEQAKGIIAERLNLEIDQAFGLLRGYARAHGRPLPELAKAVVDGAEPLPGLTASPDPAPALSLRRVLIVNLFRDDRRVLIVNLFRDDWRVLIVNLFRDDWRLVLENAWRLLPVDAPPPDKRGHPAALATGTVAPTVQRAPHQQRQR